MRTSELTGEILAELRRSQPYPAVTLVLPTDPESPYGEKSRILLRDLVTEARRRLAEDPDVQRDVRLDLRDHRLDPAVIEAANDAGHPADAMVVYLAARQPVQVWQVTAPIAATPRVEFASRFLTRYLVDAAERARPYLVLVLDQELCRLYRGQTDRLVEVREHGFPAPPQVPSPQDAVPGPIPHAAPYEGHEERVKVYLRSVDKLLGEALKAHHGLPLFVIGGQKLLAAFDALTGRADAIAGKLPLTGMDTDRPADLAKHLAPLLREYRGGQVAAALAELDKARSRGTYASGVPEVWTAVADQRVSRLMVEEGLVVAGRIVGEGRELEPVPMPEPVTLPDPKQDQTPPEPGVATDVVERLVEDALAADARVLFVPDGTLADAGGVAAVLRY